MMQCELCEKKARMYCESDRAKLCWDCDEKVHGANFLVAKHSRNLLCHSCKSSTPWKASGPKLTPTVSLCEACVAKNATKSDRAEEDHDDENSDSDYEDEDEDEDEDEEYEEEEGENQVVPLSSSSSPPPRVASFTSSDAEISSASGGGLALKRLREISQIDSDDEIGCSSSQMPCIALQDDNVKSLRFFRPLKQPRSAEPNPSVIAEQPSQANSRSAAL